MVSIRKGYLELAEMALNSLLPFLSTCLGGNGLSTTSL